MSRHRNVRSMNYSEEYEGFDDVYGHSVEDDHCISPSEARFLYDRTRHPQMSAFISEENDIAEEDERTALSDREFREFDKLKQSSIDEDRLRTCVDDIQDVIGDMVPQGNVKKVVLKYNYDVQRSLDHILDGNESSGNILLEEPLPQRERIKTKDRDEDTKASIINETSSMSGLFSGGGDGPGNPVKKFVIPKLKSVKVEGLEKGVKNLNIFENDVINNFSSLQTLMEHHQKSAVVEDNEKESRQMDLSNNSSSTLAEFSKSFLNKRNPTNIPSFPVDEKKPSFVIPKLQKKQGELSENKWLIDLTLALKSDTEPKDSPSGRDLSHTHTESHLVSQACQDSFLESNFDASKILNADLKLNSKNSSPFGKILCRKWKCNHVNVVKRENVLVSRVVHFDFSTPSPDDVILKYIWRK